MLCHPGTSRASATARAPPGGSGGDRGTRQTLAVSVRIEQALDVRDAALAYCRCGWSIVPMRQRVGALSREDAQRLTPTIRQARRDHGVATCRAVVREAGTAAVKTSACSVSFSSCPESEGRPDSREGASRVCCLNVADLRTAPIQRFELSERSDWPASRQTESLLDECNRSLARLYGTTVPQGFDDRCRVSFIGVPDARADRLAGIVVPFRFGVGSERSESGDSLRHRWIAAPLRNDRREHVRQSRRPQLL